MEPNPEIAGTNYEPTAVTAEGIFLGRAVDLSVNPSLVKACQEDTAELCVYIPARELNLIDHAIWAVQQPETLVLAAGAGLAIACMLILRRKVDMGILSE